MTRDEIEKRINQGNVKTQKKRSIKRTITKLDTKIKSNQILVDEIEKKSKLKKNQKQNK
jgi:hypothetical protein